MFLQGAWFIIAGVLLLGPAAASADEPFIKIYKDGKVYHYSCNREATQPRQAARKTPKLQRKVGTQERSGRHHLPPASVPGLIRVELNGPPEPTSPPGASSPGPLMPGRADDLQAVNPSEAQEKNIWASAHYLMRMLTDLGCRFPLALPAADARTRRVERRQDIPSLPEPQVVVAEAGVNSLTYAREQPCEWGRAQPGPGFLAESPIQGYCFPAAGPFTFRDTWGDGRSGGRRHRAVDIFAREGAEVYAITAGVIHTLTTIPEAGTILLMLGHDGRGYGYMHLQGYAPGIICGKAVRAGELLGYVGRTGLRQSAAHLHFQVYADHRLGKDEILNPYNFLVQLCHGIGVTDLYPQKIARTENPVIKGIARIENPEIKVKRIEVYRRPARSGQKNAKATTTLVITNF